MTPSLPAGSSEPTPSSEEVASSEGTRDDVFDPEAARPDAGDWQARPDMSPVDIQCNRIIDRAWSAMKPALRRLQVRVTEKVEADYRGMRTRDSSWTAEESSSFLERCRRLSATKRSCIERAPHPVAGLYRCGVLFSGPREYRPYPPTVYSHVSLLRPPVITDEHRRGVIERLQGTWVNDNPVDGYERVWTLDANGAGLEIVTRDGGKTTRTRFRLEVKRRDRLIRRTSGRRSSELWTFFEASDGSFFAAAEGYGVYRPADPTRFVVDDFGDFVFWEGPRDNQERDCEVVSATGLITRGRCVNGPERFEASWSFSEQLDMRRQPRQRSRGWTWRDGALLDERLERRARFVRATK